MESYTADAWRQALTCVSSDWDEYAPEWEAEAAVLSAYQDIEAVNRDEDVVAAVIEVAASLWVRWTPDDTLDLARAFMCSFPDMDAVKAQYITENYPGTQPEWFKDDAPVWDGMISSDELMIEVNGAVYFFARPGYARYKLLVSRETLSGGDSA